MAILWPSTLPSAPLYEGYAESAPNTTLRSSMSTGPAKVRRKSSAIPWTFTVPMHMDDSQVSEFETFVYETLYGGSLRFEFEHPRKNSTVELRILGNESLFQVAPHGSDWLVTFTVEVMP